MGRADGAYLPEFDLFFLRALTALEGAVDHLVENGWDELLRRHAHEMAVALASGAKAERRDETERTLRAVASLLELSPEQEVLIHEPVRIKLVDLMSMLQRLPTAQSA